MSYNRLSGFQNVFNGLQTANTGDPVGITDTVGEGWVSVEGASNLLLMAYGGAASFAMDIVLHPVIRSFDGGFIDGQPGERKPVYIVFPDLNGTTEFDGNASALEGVRGGIVDIGQFFANETTAAPAITAYWTFMDQQYSNTLSSGGLVGSPAAAVANTPAMLAMEPLLPFSHIAIEISGMDAAAIAAGVNILASVIRIRA